jgi:hypothetical protein
MFCPHTHGSGKSNTRDWTPHHVINLHDATDRGDVADCGGPPTTALLRRETEVAELAKELCIPEPLGSTR